MDLTRNSDKRKQRIKFEIIYSFSSPLDPFKPQIPTLTYNSHASQYKQERHYKTNRRQW